MYYFWVWRLFFGVWGGFGGFDIFLGLGVDIEGFVFCWMVIFGLFLDLVGVLKLWYCIVVTSPKVRLLHFIQSCQGLHPKFGFYTLYKTAKDFTQSSAFTLYTKLTRTSHNVRLFHFIQSIIFIQVVM